MSVTLCFDFGNTRLKCAIFHGDQFVKEIVLPDTTQETLLNLIRTENADQSVLSSVIHHDESIEILLKEHTHFHKISSESKKNIGTPFPKTTSVGADRWALLSGALNIFPHQHNLIIGLGSCITYNFLDCFDQFLGGAISPGLQMRFKAMNDHTALLPLVTPEWNFPLVGYDTKTNLLSGVILGMSKEIDGMIDAYKEKYDQLNVLLTGGDMVFFTPHLKNQVLADAQLTYKGIYSIGKLNGLV
ncbi:type III pantothenate kinase [Rhizosphaericola mali]|uniref:Type III pantothenate kinase n=1 Tax=Rhizosphaericola mali TaxID=2545455 RepID=A0A5P2GF15_9BACT|nr:type III pantothenate kinase [Rhizosphaericola mali]QES90201.1 type III pantothenate kinase [Rhizosphaericola mali]